MLKKAPEKGFTLIESMIAMLIVSVGLLAMANLLITAIKVNHTNEIRLEASSLAQSTMAYYLTQVKEQPPVAFALDFAGGDTVPPAFTNAASIYTPTVVFTPAATADCSFTNIEVKVAWTMHGQTKSVLIRSGVMKNDGGC